MVACGLLLTGTSALLVLLGITHHDSEPFGVRLQKRFGESLRSQGQPDLTRARPAAASGVGRTEKAQPCDGMLRSSSAEEPSWLVPSIVIVCCVILLAAAAGLLFCCLRRNRRDRSGRRDFTARALLSPSPETGEQRSSNAGPRASESDLFRTPRETDTTCDATFVTGASGSWPRPCPRGAEGRMSLQSRIQPSLPSSHASTEGTQVRSSHASSEPMQVDMDRVQFTIRLQLQQALHSGVLAAALNGSLSRGEDLETQTLANVVEENLDEQEPSAPQPEPEPSDRPSTSSGSAPRSTIGSSQGRPSDRLSASTVPAPRLIAGGSQASSAKSSMASSRPHSLAAPLLSPSLDERDVGVAVTAEYDGRPEAASVTGVRSARPSYALPPPLDEFAATFSGEMPVTTEEQRNSGIFQVKHPLLSEVEEAWLRMVFLHCDVHSKGEISFAELSAALIQRPDIALRFGLNLRPDARGRKQNATQALEDFFRTIDTDSTLEISWSELYAFYTRHRSDRPSNSDSTHRES